MSHTLKLRDELSAIYADRTDLELIEWLEQKGLWAFFQRITIQLNDLIVHQNELFRSCRTIPVNHLVSITLKELNEKIKQASSIDEMKEMENILGDICSRLLRSFFGRIKTHKKEIWEQINAGLKGTCDIYQFDYLQLLEFLKIDKIIAEEQSRLNSERANLPMNVPFFYWAGNDEDLKKLLKLFEEQRLMKSKKGLRELFGSPMSNLRLSFNEAKADTVLQLFYTLKKLKYLTAKGRRGFYQVLIYHSLDFEKLILKNSEPKFRINSLRQSKKKWAENQSHIDKWISNFKAIESSKT